MRLITCDTASPPGGHHSQAAQAGDLIFVSGQLGFEPGTRIKRATTVDQETRNCLQNLRVVLEAAGSSLDQLVKVTIYVSSIEYWATVDDVFADVMGDHRPARAIVPCGPLHAGFNVEVDAVARSG